MRAVGTDQKLLTKPDGLPFEVFNPNGQGQVVLVCEHASAFIPQSLAGLGLDPKAAASHAAWDPGALAVARRLSSDLDAPLLAARVSRLVYDCNRPPTSCEAMRDKSELVEIPGNRNLTQAARDLRVREIYDPFRARLANMLAERARTRPAPVLVTIHSFTPTYFGTARSVELGLLHDADDRLARQMLANAGDLTAMDARLNEPYGPKDGVTHTLVEHALPAGLLNVMIEVRNDLIASADRIEKISGELAAIIGAGLAACNQIPAAMSGRGQ